MAAEESIPYSRTSRHPTSEQDNIESIKNHYRRKLRRAYRRLDEERSVREGVQESLENVEHLLHGEIDRRRREIDMVSKENQQVKEKLARERAKVQRLETELECRGNLLQTRTEELRNVQGILAIPDEPSDVDILRMVHHINAMAFQCSAHLVDGWTFTAGRKGRHSNEAVARAIGKEMVDILQSGPHEEQQVLTQIAAQACFTYSVAWIISAWSFSSEVTLLADLYDTLHEKETQVTRGIWRSITLRHVKTLPRVQEQVSNFHREILDVLTNILLLSGVEGVPEDIHEEVLRRSKKKVQDIIELALAARELARINVISCDFEPSVIKFGENYNIRTMEDAYEKERREPKSGEPTGKVLCTIEIGLTRRQKCGEGDGRKGEAEQTTTIPLKPKVVLGSQIQEMVRGSTL